MIKNDSFPSEGGAPLYDPQDPGVLDNPFPFSQQMRERCPVHYNDKPYPPYFTVFRSEDVRNVGIDAEHWTNRYSNAPVFMKAVGIMQDGAAHSEFRKLFAPRMMAGAIEKHRGWIAQIIEELIDAMLTKDGGCFHDDFALPLPVRVIARLLGIPGADFWKFKHWSDELTELGFGQDSARYTLVYTEVSAWFRDLVRERQAKLHQLRLAEAGIEQLGHALSDDLISVLVLSAYQGRRLTDHEIEFTLIGLMVGGNETTTSLITNCVWRLLEVPERWERLKREPNLIEIAIEESLRFDSPTLGMWRTSTCPVSLHGVEIPAKTKMMMAFGSANRDPAVFDNPEEFDLNRSLTEARKHLAFSTGPHVCPGAPISRLEARMALAALIERVPALRLDGPTTRIASFNFWGRRKMPVAWR